MGKVIWKNKVQSLSSSYAIRHLSPQQDIYQRKTKGNEFHTLASGGRNSISLHSSWRWKLTVLLEKVRISRLVRKFVVRLEDFMAVKVHTFIVWVMTPCSLVRGYQCFGEIYCLHVRGKTRTTHMTRWIYDCSIHFSKFWKSVKLN
jgi:hypothetical protein